MPWNEKDHPRADDGKFTDGNKSNARKTLDRIGMNDRRRGATKKIGLDFFKNKTQSAVQESRVIPPIPKKAYCFESNKKRNTKHHLGHVSELGYKNKEEYERAAVYFWNKGKGAVYYSERRGNYCKIGNDGLTVCFCNSEGIIQSFYRYPNQAKVRNFMKLEKLRGI